MPVRILAIALTVIVLNVSATTSATDLAPLPPGETTFGFLKQPDWLQSDTAAAWGADWFSFRTLSGLSAGIEVPMLKPHLGNTEEIDLVTPNLAVASVIEDNEYSMSPRLWLAYTTDYGLGVRGRWWLFDHTLKAETYEAYDDTDALLAASSGGLEFEAVDVEALQSMELGCWEASLGGGARYGRTEHVTAMNVLPSEGGALLDSASDFDGIGPTLFGEFRRPLRLEGVALVASGRGSLLFGEERFTQSFSGDPALLDELGLRELAYYEKHDSTVGVAEIQLGGEYTREIPGGVQFSSRLVAEGQMWSGADRALNYDNGDLGLVGITSGVGLSR